MESFFADLFLDMQERIKTEVPEIEWIEQDFGQDQYDKWRPNVAFPAVLIDFPDTQYDELATGSQLAIATVSVRLFVAPFSQSYEDAPIEVRRDALQFFELEKKVVGCLQKWMPDAGYCQPLIRTRATSSNRNDVGLRIRELTFTTEFEDYLE